MSDFPPDAFVSEILSLHDERDALKAEIAALHADAFGGCGCRFSTDTVASVLVARCAFHIGEIEDRDAEIVRLKAENADLLPMVDADAFMISNLSAEVERLTAVVARWMEWRLPAEGFHIKNCSFDTLPPYREF
jgi:uncharacterized small protein (DUF1192 family)